MTSGLPLAARFARLLADVSINQVSAAGRQMAIDAITDTVAVTLAGSAEPGLTILKDVLLDGAGGDGSVSILGDDGRRVTPLDAAMINGTAAHAIDYDDMASAMGGHPSVPVVPVVLALGEVLGSTGRQVLDAYVVGFEAECRLGRAVHHYHYERGWHPTSTLGVFGAAAAAARLLGFNDEQMATALALAASQASGIKANFGTMTKPFHVGHCARSGLLSAQLVARGFTANPQAFDHKQGFLAAYNGLDNVDPEKMFADIGTRYEIEQERIGLKQFPCCGSTHPAILAMLQLRQRETIDPGRIDRIEIHAHPRRFPHTDNPDPKSALGAKFSVQYAAARALLDGPPRIGHFEGNAFDEPAVRAVMSKITLVPFEAGLQGVEHEMGAEIVVRDQDGSFVSHRLVGVLGRGPANPMDDDEKWSKFSDCYSLCFAQTARMRPAFDALQTIDAQTDVRDLVALISA